MAPYHSSAGGFNPIGLNLNTAPSGIALEGRHRATMGSAAQPRPDLETYVNKAEKAWMVIGLALAVAGFLSAAVG